MASGLREASLRTAITGAVIFLAFSALSRLRVKKFWAATIIFFAGNLFTAGAIVAVSTIAFGSLQGQPAPQAFAVLFIWIAQTAFMTSFFQSATNTRQEVREQLARIAGQLNVNADVLRLRNQIAAREYANHLHSNVQNQLLSLALRVESGQGIRVEEELSDIERLLDAATFHIEVSSLKEALESMSQRWLGFAKVDLDVELTCPVCEPSETLQRLASEALNNAVRHGLAQTISISARCDGFAAHFTVIDDGIGPKVEAVEGLGTKFFESISDGNWSLEPHDEGGSILKIRVPHERQ
jgi:signal transduction histidine kinase